MAVFSTTEPRSDTQSSLRWAAVASLRSFRAIFWFSVCKLLNFSCSLSIELSVRRAQIHVASKNSHLYCRTVTIQRTVSICKLYGKGQLMSELEHSKLDTCRHKPQNLWYSIIRARLCSASAIVVTASKRVQQANDFLRCGRRGLFLSVTCLQ